MLYLNSIIRSYTLRRKTRVVEKCFATLAEESGRILQIPNSILTFDHGVSSEITKQLSDNVYITVNSAKTQGSPSTDEAFVSFIRNNPGLAPTTLIVTSDRELIGRLKELNVMHFMKPGYWLKFTISLLQGNEHEWFEELMSKLDN